MDPDARLDVALRFVEDHWPDAIVGVGSPESSRVDVRLSPECLAAAEYLYAQVGGSASIRLGFFSYPMTGMEKPLEWAESLPRLDESIELRARVGLSVQAGRSQREDLTLQNRTSNPIVVVTNGALSSVVVDPRTHRPIAGSNRPRRSRRVTFRLMPGEPTRIPAIIGTASLRPELGYVLRPGRWALDAVLAVQGAGRGRTGPVPLLIEAAPGLDELTESGSSSV